MYIIGILSPSEWFGALMWLEVPGLTADDVADFIEAVDKNRDGLAYHYIYIYILKIDVYTYLQYHITSVIFVYMIIHM